MRILLIEGDDLLSGHLQRRLLDAGFVADRVSNAEEALLWPYPNSLDAILLDIDLPGMDGASFISTWRGKDRQTPILVISGRSNWEEKAKCLNAGADDYLVKPIRSDALIARLQGLDRLDASDAREDAITLGPIELYPDEKRVLVFGQHVLLSALEYRLLVLLISHQDGFLTLEQAGKDLYPRTTDRQIHIVEAHFARLRRKIGEDLIINTQGRGYQLAV